uniref:Uncharacterized protein n=1 Tax=Rhizophora mucronata TaxID=61149 RepID=A0A2P2L389_RHIMU
MEKIKKNKKSSVKGGDHHC